MSVVYCYICISHGGLIPVEFCFVVWGECDNKSMFIMICLACSQFEAGCVMLVLGETGQWF